MCRKTGFVCTLYYNNGLVIGNHGTSLRWYLNSPCARTCRTFTYDVILTNLPVYVGNTESKTTSQSR